MKKLFVCLILSIFLLFVSLVFAESKASYVFRHGQPKEFVLEQTRNILDSYGFPVIRHDSEKGRIETDFHLVVRKVMPDFRLKYTILITEQKYGTRIDVSAVTKRVESNGTTGKRIEIKSAWWIVKMLVKTMGR